MLIAATRYRDCAAALTFLTDVLEMGPHAVFRDDDGAIQHAQLRVGRGMLMIGPEADTPFGAFMVAPREVGMRETTTVYAVVRDVVGLHGRVRDKGAEIVMPLEAQDYGGSSFSVRDPEGHIFSFGDYDPFGP
jgi:uncharacterized glyoxalase superfamily protein PhnB